MNSIRKISVGVDPKNAMHYIVGKPMGAFVVHSITQENDGCVKVFVNLEDKPNSIYPWKTFNPYVPITFEHFIDVE